MNRTTASAGYLLAMMSCPWVARLITRARGKYRKQLRKEMKQHHELILMVSVTGGGDVPDGFRSIARRWHGSIKNKARNIDNFVTYVLAHPNFKVPPDLFPRIVVLRDRVMELIRKCGLPSSSLIDRGERNAALVEAVDLCTGRGKSWAHEMHATGEMTAEDVHALGFPLLGENGGRRERSEPNREKALLKVEVRSDDFVSVVVDRSAGENAARVTRGWPRGVKFVLIVILADDGVTEVYRHMSSRQRNEIQMPPGSHGGQFIAKAAFLKHVDDMPHFGNQEVFSMPCTIADLVSAREKMKWAVNKEIERLKAELEEAKRQNKEKEDKKKGS